MSLPKFEQKYSYADYLTWDENERWEIMDGTPYMQVEHPDYTKKFQVNYFCNLVFI